MRLHVLAVSLGLFSCTLISSAWGYDDRGFYRDDWRSGDRYDRSTVRCESENFSFRRCPVRTRGEVSIIRELSNTSCRQGENWGYDRRGIWVDKGCAAEFAVGRSEARYHYDNDRDRWGRDDRAWDRGSVTDRGTIRCESEEFAFTRCRVRTGGDVRIVRQLSETQCRRGENWGYDRRGIWVDKGCAADFAVAGSGAYYTDRR